MIIREEKLLLKDFPNLNCPNCAKGILRIVDDTKILKYPSEFRLLPDEPSFYFDHDGNEHRRPSIDDVEAAQKQEYIATFFLECPRTQCLEMVSTCGKVRYDTEVFPDEDLNPVYDTQLYFYPKFFYPHINLFNIPIKTPKVIVDQLAEAFSLFWPSPSACGNSIRKCVERIIDEVDSPPTSYVNLDTRIKNLGQEYSALKEFLMATKWIGNDASHQSELLYYDVVLAFEFIEQCLIELYKNEQKDLNSLAQEINTSKKPISKSTE